MFARLFNFTFAFTIGTIGALLALSGCGTGVDGPSQEYGDFEPYVGYLETQAKEHGTETRGLRSISITLRELEPGEDGRCERTFFNRNVLISPRYWNGASENGKRVLILHEMGHCFFNKEHEGGKKDTLSSETGPTSDSIPLSVMNASTLSGSTFSQNVDYYLSQYFNR